MLTPVVNLLVLYILDTLLTGQQEASGVRLADAVAHTKMGKPSKLFVLKNISGHETRRKHLLRSRDQAGHPGSGGEEEDLDGRDQEAEQADRHQCCHGPAENEMPEGRETRPEGRREGQDRKLSFERDQARRKEAILAHPEARGCSASS